jgi:sortase A
MKKKASTILLMLILLIGLSLLLYPTLSELWNSFHQSQSIAGYVEKMASIDNEEYEEILQAAKDYNARYKRESLWYLQEDEVPIYQEQLNVGGDGVMGYIEIPKIKCSLPIYHGTSESVLQVAVGHIEGSSLPVGGESTHCVLSGHRGLPSAKLFTNLDQLVTGDLFVLYVLDEVFTFEVDQIRIVEPDDVSDLAIEEGEELCTLVTCTPYGINSHRLLVRGHRVDNIYVSSVRVAADAVQVDETLVALAIGIPMLLVFKGGEVTGKSVGYTGKQAIVDMF